MRPTHELIDVVFSLDDVSLRYLLKTHCSDFYNEDKLDIDDHYCFVTEEEIEEIGVDRSVGLLYKVVELDDKLEEHDFIEDFVYGLEIQRTWILLNILCTRKVIPPGYYFVYEVICHEIKEDNKLSIYEKDYDNG